MAGVINTPRLSPSSEVVSFHEAETSRLQSRMTLGAILLLSIFMNFFLLGENGYGNFYYAAGVRSMTDNWHNFFFASFDPGGFVSIDKPPLGFWLQALSAKIFGFTPFSLFLPQAICGVLAVALLYYLVRHHFGEIAGLIAALVLVVTPITVLTDRNNTIDGTLALVLLLAAWAVIQAAETGKLRWLLLSGVFVGLGFNIKMAEAYLVLPALALTYLLCAPHKIWTRIWHLLLALAVMLVVSLSWAVAVDLTPAAQHPYVGSTPNNSALSLAFGYNGVGRFHIWGGNSNPDIAHSNILQQALAGPLRLFSITLGGQIAWLLPFALLAIVALAWQRRFNFREDRLQMGLILWGFWLLTMVIFFTLDVSFHQYYMTEMAPGLSALVGIGLVTMWQDYRSSGWHGWLLPIALAVTASAQIAMLASYYSTWSRWLSLLIGILTTIAIIVLIFLRLKPCLSLRGFVLFRAAGLVASAGLLALLITPALWSDYTVMNNTEGAFPTAGPVASSSDSPGGQDNSGFFVAAPRGRMPPLVDPGLVSYLETHQGHAKFLVATIGSSPAAPIILSTNRPVMAMGGYSAHDPTPTISALQSMVRHGNVRFFLVDPSMVRIGQAIAHHTGPVPPSAGQYSAVSLTWSAWIGDHCTPVSGKEQGKNQLYDCAPPPAIKPSHHYPSTSRR